MSEYKVSITRIRNIAPHPNADRLELATVYGFQVVVPKNKYGVNSQVVYIPIDSILPPELEAKLFPEGSKITLKNHRVRQIRIRKFPSQGMLVDMEDLKEYNIENFDDETDVSSILGVTKYEPPVAYTGVPGQKKLRKPLINRLFHEYNGIDNIKWFPDFFQPGEEVVVQEKIHGTNCRIARLPSEANTFWKKVKKFFGLLSKYEFCYGSNHVQLQERKNFKGFYEDNVYLKALQNVNAFEKVRDGETVFGEVVGPSIQKNYDYGHKDYHFIIFDVKVLKEDGSQEWLSPDAVEAYARERGFDFVPVLYRGGYNKELVEGFVSGPSSYYPPHKVKEGIVVKRANNYSIAGNKQVVKIINPEYLDREQTDFH